MLKFMGKGIVGIDLAAKSENPTGWALWKDNVIKTTLMYDDEEILKEVTKTSPDIIAIDAPLTLPKKGLFRKADVELIKTGYRVFPPGLPSMRLLTLRAMEINRLIAERGIKTIEVHPTSTRKALSMPLKNPREVQKVFEELGLNGSLKERLLTAHEIDAITAALTAYLYLAGLTEIFGDEEEGYIVVPRRINWRTLKHGK
ncbi:MAG: DUF429 domain-containing protein [Candidatus Bathyarchaeia archaeon]